MKNIHKNFTINLALLFMVSTSLSAQPGGGPKMERFKDEKIAYFNEQLELSTAEAELFWPVYDDFQNRMMKINEDERSLLNYFDYNADAMAEDEIDETIEKYMSLQNSRMLLSSDYHESFVEVLGKKKTMELYTLERKFRMYILEKFRGKHQGQGSGSGRGYGKGNR